MTEYLKELFGGGAITYDQFVEKLGKAEDVKLANLKEGGYVGKDKFDTLTTERDGLKQQLDEANKTLAGFDPEWKEKAKSLQEEAAAKVLQVQFDYGVKAALKDAKAKNPDMLAKALNLDALKLTDGKIIGLDEQLSKLKETDGYLFESEAPTVEIIKPGNGVSRQTNEQAALDSFYAGNPFYHQK